MNIAYKLSSFLFFFISSISIAQPVFNQLPTFTDGMVIHLKGDEYTGANPDVQSGANQTWDYSTLNPLYAFADTVHLGLFGGVIRDTFPQATYYNRESDSSESYYQVVGDTLFLLGLYTPEDTAVSNAGYTDMTFFPMIYETLYKDTVYNRITYHNSLSFIDYETSYQETIYDGYGTLITPLGTFENIGRIKTTVYTVSDGNNHNIETQYAWLYPGDYTPHLSIDKIENYSGTYLTDTDWSFYIASTAVPTAIVKATSLSSLLTYPQPVSSGKAHVQGNELEGNYSVSIYSINGTLMKSSQELASNHTVSLAINSLPAGFYSVELINDAQSYRGTIIVK